MLAIAGEHPVGACSQKSQPYPGTGWDASEGAG